MLILFSRILRLFSCAYKTRQMKAATYFLLLWFDTEVFASQIFQPSQKFCPLILFTKKNSILPVSSTAGRVDFLSYLIIQAYSFIREVSVRLSFILLFRTLDYLINKHCAFINFQEKSCPVRSYSIALNSTMTALCVYLFLEKYPALCAYSILFDY